MDTNDDTQASAQGNGKQPETAYEAALRRFIAAVKHCEATSEAYIEALQKHSLAQQAERAAHQEVLRVDTVAMNAKLELLEAQLELERAKAGRGTH